MSRSNPRVLHVLEALEGGTARHVIDVVTHAERSHHIVVVPRTRVGSLTDETAIDRLDAAGAQVQVLTMHRTPWAPANVTALAKLRRMIRRELPDVVHGHSSIGGLLARMATTHTGIPTVYTPNAIAPSRKGIVVERLLGWRTDRLIAVSPSEAELVLKLRISDSQRIVVIPNGIEPALPPPPISLRSELGLSPTTPLVGTIARLAPQKDPETFVAACALVAELVRRAHFVMIGDGELGPQVDRAIDQAGLRPQFHRIPTLDGAAGVLGELDVFALSSRFEGAPYAPLEAMRANTAVVLPAVVGCRDTVEHGVSGILVPPGDPTALGMAIADLLQHPDTRARIAAAGRARVHTSFSASVMGATLDQLYASLTVARRDRTRR